MQRTALWLSLVFLASFSQPILATADDAAPALQKIPQQLQTYVDNGQVSGAVALVADENDTLHLSAVGLADIAGDVPMRPDALFCIASMTKPITATAVMILADDGKLAIDDPVSKYIPEFADAALKSGPPARPLTIRDLMTHTSGVVGDQQNIGSLENTARELAKRPLGFHPGAKWEYSPGLSVCGRVIEVASGRPYEQFLQERIFEPLGMSDTTFTPNAEQQKRLVKLYQPGAGGRGLVEASHWLRDLSDDRTPNPSGGLFSTAADMARFYQMVLGQGEFNGRRIVSADAVAEMTKIHTGDLKAGFTPGCGWGLGWGVVRKPQGVTAMLSPGTFGHGGAFGTQGWIDPQQKLIFVLMIQRTGFGNGDAADIRRDFQQLAVDAQKK